MLFCSFGTQLGLMKGKGKIRRLVIRNVFSMVCRFQESTKMKLHLSLSNSGVVITDGMN